jgi:hypothetical protein
MQIKQKKSGVKIKVVQQYSDGGALQEDVLGSPVRPSTFEEHMSNTDPCQ